MNINPLLEKLNGAKIGVAGNENKLFPTNIARVLSEKGAKIVLFTVGDEQSTTIEKQDVVIAPFDMKLPDTMTSGQVLRWRLGNENGVSSESVDIDDVSPNSFALRVAELIDESKFKLPEWFEGYNFKWEGTVIEHPVTNERCRKIRLFKTFEEGNIRETYAHIYLDEAGQLFNASIELEPKKPGAGIYTVRNRVPSKNTLSPDSKVKTNAKYTHEGPVGERNPEEKNLSFFKNTEI